AVFVAVVDEVDERVEAAHDLCTKRRSVSESAWRERPREDGGRTELNAAEDLALERVGEAATGRRRRRGMVAAREMSIRDEGEVESVRVVSGLARVRRGKGSVRVRVTPW
ncbi:hypothetical protein RTBOTA2_004789, partial [Rhodotorula toruloides]